jgi:tryptophanyl-tRNA synthetase
METVVSGIRSTGNLHLGNYFGAIQNFIKMQHEHRCFFFIADLHALTTHPKPGEFKSSVKNVMVEYLAAGLDPNLCTLFIQSDVPQISELYLLFNMYAYVGELERCTSFKEKIRKHADNINAGLLTYPVLMAADIIIHKARFVPVGKDQEQHLEMARNFVNRFNHLYQVDYFPEPVAYNFGNELVKVPGLDGNGKMGKSEGEGNAVFLSDEPAVIRKKLSRAITDSGPTQPNQAKPEVIGNLFQLLKLVSSEETISHFEISWNDCSIRYGDLKKQLAEDIILFTAPIRDRILEIQSNDRFLKEVMILGAEKARESAAQTLKDVRAIIGLISN